MTDRFAALQKAYRQGDLVVLHMSTAWGLLDPEVDGLGELADWIAKNERLDIPNIKKATDAACGMSLQFKEEDGELILDLSEPLETVAIVAAQLEREECAKVCELSGNSELADLIRERQ